MTTILKEKKKMLLQILIRIHFKKKKRSKLENSVPDNTEDQISIEKNLDKI